MHQGEILQPFDQVLFLHERGGIGMGCEKTRLPFVFADAVAQRGVGIRAGLLRLAETAHPFAHRARRNRRLLLLADIGFQFAHCRKRIEQALAVVIVEQRADGQIAGIRLGL